MIIIKNNILPFKGFVAMNICGILFVREEHANKLTKETINHEKIHTKQMVELLILPFYLLYGLEWFIRLFITGDGKEAYRNISFEKEVYEHESDLAYLDNRKWYAQWR